VVVETICDSLDQIRPDSGGRPRRELIDFVKDRPGHDRRYAMDCTKIETELGWTPEETFKTGIDKTICWYLDNMEWVDRVKGGEYRQWIKQHYG
jgi:dTDP-glucose 4,6-dehydratase